METKMLVLGVLQAFPEPDKRARDLLKASTLAYLEAERAARKFKPFNSSHEGYAVLKEEVDELWDAIKDNDLEQARREAIQVAAMALRYLTDLPGTKEYDPAPL